MSHTPGPWTAKHTDDGTIEAWQVYGPNPDEWVADCGIGGNAEDCARLIAALPELLEALRTAADWLHDDPNDEANPEFDKDMKQIRAAIAKATGGAK